MLWRSAVLSVFLLAAVGCEDDARDLDHLKPKPIVVPDAGSVTAPDAGSTGGTGGLSAPDAGMGTLPVLDASSDDDAG